MAEPMTKREQLERRLAELKTERESFFPHWQELTKFLSPRTGRYLTTNKNKGSKANDAIINSCATTSLRTLKSGMHAGMTSQSRPWFRLMNDDADLMKFKPVKAWLHEMENRMRTVFARSNFYNVMPQMYGATGGHGTAAMAILEDRLTTIRCYPFPVGSFFIALNDRLECDTLYRQFAMTVRQLVMQFGLENTSQTVRNLWDRSNYEQQVEVTQAIEPNSGRDPGKLDARDKPIRSVHWENGNSKGDAQFLSESGFDEFPVMAPRWDVEGDDVYGYSPGMDALGTVKGLQFTEKRKAEALDKLVRPPMVADTALKDSGSSMVPGGVTYIDNLAAQRYAGFRPAYQFQPHIGELRQDIEAQKQEIRKIFFEDLMLMFATSDINQVTAREVEERHQEKLLVLGPTIERFGEELYDRAIDRTFNIMLRRGEVPPPPPELHGQPLKVEYISVMAQAQKLVGTASMERVAAYAGNLSQFDQGVLDKFNAPAAFEEYANMHGVSPNTIRSDEEVARIQENRAQKEQAKAAIEAAPALGNVATAAKTLSETDVSDVSALTRLMGAR